MSQLLTPPAVPVAILNFFASQPDFPAVAGDISEEFQQRAQTSGPQAARRWYWHEAFRNASALTWRELMRTPVRTTLIAFGCFLAANLAIDLYAFLRYYPLPALDSGPATARPRVGDYANIHGCFSVLGSARDVVCFF